MDSREEIQAAKRMLETAERRLVDARTMHERLTRVIPEATQDFRPSLERALTSLTAVTPRLEADFNQAHDVLRTLAFVSGLDVSRISTRSGDGSPHGLRHYRRKTSR